MFATSRRYGKSIISLGNCLTLLLEHGTLAFTALPFHLEMGAVHALSSDPLPDTKDPFVASFCVCLFERCASSLLTFADRHPSLCGHRLDPPATVIKAPALAYPQMTLPSSFEAALKLLGISCAAREREVSDSDLLYARATG